MSSVKVRWSIVIAVFAGLLASTAYARSPVPVVNHENVAVTTGTGRAFLSADEVKAAIIAAAGRTQYGWSVTDGEAGTLVATTRVRGKHTAVASISYNSSSYSVTYRDSSDLNFKVVNGVPKIHPNYNVWVQQLVDAIRVQLQQL